MTNSVVKTALNMGPVQKTNQSINKNLIKKT